ncbi:MAG: DUF4258 domain-containing protein [Alphaproteobacteria bacterium]|nr:DUF4258 domain-containing protein [Alphaproteobacteria bacterium]
MIIKTQNWQSGLSTAAATDGIRALVRDDEAVAHIRVHFKEQLNQRGLLISDALHVLKYGFVYDKPEQSTQPGFWKYKMQSTSPNSGKRKLEIVVIPDFNQCGYKLITIYWVDGQ